MLMSIKNPTTIVEASIIGNLEEGEFVVQQNGIDLTLASAEEIRGGILEKDKPTIDKYTNVLETPLGFVFEAGRVYSIWFQQEIKLPANLCAQIVQRSSLNRMGGMITTGLYDSGFQGQLGAVLRVDAPIIIEKGARVAQVIFMEAESASLYDGRYQKSQAAK